MVGRLCKMHCAVDVSKSIPSASIIIKRGTNVVYGQEVLKSLIVFA